MQPPAETDAPTLPEPDARGKRRRRQRDAHEEAEEGWPRPFTPCCRRCSAPTVESTLPCPTWRGGRPGCGAVGDRGAEVWTRRRRRPLADHRIRSGPRRRETQSVDVVERGA